MTQKEIFNIVFKFSALLVFAFLFNKSIESRPFNHFEGSLPLKGEKTIVMEMDGDFDLDTIDLDKISDINVDGESIEIIINGKTISLPLDKMTEMKDNQHSCKDCEQDMICEDCEEKK